MKNEAKIPVFYGAKLNELIVSVGSEQDCHRMPKRYEMMKQPVPVVIDVGEARVLVDGRQLIAATEAAIAAWHMR